MGERKVLIVSRHTEAEFGRDRLALIKKTHGIRTTIEFEDKRFEGEPDIKKAACIEFFEQKQAENYYCYVVLPKYLKTALLEKGISFGVLTYPEKVKGGLKITAEHYSPETSGPVIKASKVVNKKKRESRDYKNKSGRRRGCK